MELRHLRYFIAAAEEEHFGRASERLHITRPAVSQLIADLENELGTLLFERLAHRVRLTAAGRALLPQLQNLMANLDQALTLAKRMGDGEIGALNVGYGSLSLLHPVFRASVRKFREDAPEVTLSLIDITSAEQYKALASGKIDVGFMHLGPQTDTPTGRGRRGSRSPGAEPALETLRIESARLGAVMPRDHPLAGRRSVALSDLANEHFVVVPRSSVSPGYGKLYSLCLEAGFEPKIVQEVDTFAAQLNLVSVGMGIGLAVIGGRFAYPSELAVVPLKGVSYATSFVLGWMRGRREPVLQRLIDIVRDQQGDAGEMPG